MKILRRKEKMIKGTGVDIVKVSRVKESLAAKVLTGSEEYKNAEHFAGVFAAKEAILKAIGCGISEISFKDIEIIYDHLGAPKVLFSNSGNQRLKDMKSENVFLSISHEREYAVAFAVIE